MNNLISIWNSLAFAEKSAFLPNFSTLLWWGHCRWHGFCFRIWIIHPLSTRITKKLKLVVLIKPGTARQSYGTFWPVPCSGRPCSQTSKFQSLNFATNYSKSSLLSCPVCEIAIFYSILEKNTFKKCNSVCAFPKLPFSSHHCSFRHYGKFFKFL